MSEEIDLMTVAEVADVLHVTPTTIRRKVHSGELGAIRLSRSPQGDLRIPRSELERFLAEGSARELEVA